MGGREEGEAVGAKAQGSLGGGHRSVPNLSSCSLDFASGFAGRLSLACMSTTHPLLGVMCMTHPSWLV